MDTRWRRLTVLGLLILFSAFVRPARGFQTSGFQDTVVAGGFSGPTAMEFAPDGRLFVAEQAGHLRIIKNGTLLPTDFMTLSVSSDNERGLLGIAFDPNFVTNRFLYVYYTRTTAPIKNRVSRFTASASNPDVVQPNSEVVILDNIGSDSGNHNGGAIHFGLDGKLFVAVGDGGANSSNSQSLSTLSGKLLRINPDGTIPPDNPFTSVSGARGEIVALGLRNPYTFAVDSQTGNIYINDVGQNSWEEINLGAAGANYGWPVCEGLSCNNPSYTNPIYTYSHAEGQAITGGAFYHSTQFPGLYEGSYFFSDYLGGWIRRMNTSRQVFDFWNPQNGPVDLKVGPDGCLYYLSIFNGEVHKISNTTGNQLPTASFTATPNSGAPPLAVSFNGSASSDPDSDALTYSWNFGDGSPLGSGATVSHTYQSSGSYVAVLTVNDGRGGNGSSSKTIAVGTPPVGTIVTPAQGTLYNAGDTISYSGSASDAEDGTLPASRFSWTIVFHHDAHTHPFLGPINGVTSGTFQIPTTGESSANTWYRIHLFVTDSTGLTQETTRDVFPRKATITLATNVPGLSLTLDGQPFATPYSVDSVVGFTRTLGAPSPQTVGGQTYGFVSWSDGGAQTHTINTPAANSTYTATYQVITPPPSSGIALDAATRSANGNNIASVSWPHTVTNSGSNPILVVGAISRDSTDSHRLVTSVQYNGVNLTLIRQDNEMTNNVYSSLWYLLNPAPGLHTITVTYAAPVTEAFGMAASFTGVDPASPIDAHNGFTQSAGMALSQTITTVANNAWMLDVQYAGADGGVTPTSGQTQLTNQPIASGRTNDMAVMTVKGPLAQPGTSVVSYSYSESSQVALSIVSLKPAPSSADATPPTTPANLTASSASSSAVNLSWNASTDNIGVAGYKIFRNGNSIATTVNTSYSDTGLSPSTTYSYTVSAFDSAGNESPQSSPATATTAALGSIALDLASRSSNGNNVNSISWSHTVTNNGSNTVLIVGGVSRDGTDSRRPVIGITYNGVNLTRVREDDEPVNNVYSSLWYLVNPAPGPHTITITYAGAVTEAFGMAASFTGVDQNAPIDASAGSVQSSGMTISTSITTVSNGALILDAQYAGADGSITATSGQVALTHQAVGLGRTNDRAMMTMKGPISPAGTITGGYSYSESSQVALSLIALKPAP
jgi:glucose/arabinose dehydrogenase/chitodextrinase